MKRRTVVVLVVVAILVLAAPAVVSWLLSGSRVDQEHYDAIQVGMSRAEIERLLGAPRNEIAGQATVWVPRDGKKVSQRIAPAEPPGPFFPDAPQGDQELVWLGVKGLIAVRVGDDGGVREKYFSTVHDLDPSTVDLLLGKFER